MAYEKIVRFQISGGPADGSVQVLHSPMEIDRGSFTYAECDGHGYECTGVVDGTAFMRWLSLEEMDRLKKKCSS